MTKIHKFYNVVNYVFQKSLSRNELRQTRMYKRKMIYLENSCIKRFTIPPPPPKKKKNFYAKLYAIIIFHTKI